MRLGKDEELDESWSSGVRVFVDLKKVQEFFKYRKGPQMKHRVCELILTEKDIELIQISFVGTEHIMDNHISWIQDDGMLYVLSDSRLYIGIPKEDRTLLMFAQ